MFWARNILIASLAAMLSSSSAVAADFAGGDGSATNPYLISTPQQLDNLHNYCGNAGANKHFALSNDIDIYDYIRTPNAVGNYGGAGNHDGKGWRPICDYGNPFGGSINGNGFRITGMWMNRPTENNVGLFGRTYQANIQGLGVDVATWKEVEGGSNVGALIGHMTGGYLYRCYATGSTVRGDGNVGGLVGKVENVMSPNFSQNYASINVVAVHVAGGLVGRVINSTIDNSYAVCRIVTASVDTIGGLAGYVSGSSTIRKCYAACHFKDPDNNHYLNNESIGNRHRGGLVGMKMNNSNYENCYFNNNYETESAGIIQGATPSITGLSTTQMVLQANFSGFDFTDPWSICPQYAAPPLDGNGAANPVHGHSYPYFAWQQAIPPAIITQTNTASGNITLMFALIAPADSFGFTGMRDTNLYEEQTMWALCSSSECHPPYSPTMVMSFWTLQGTPDVGKYYSITAKYAGCQRQSTPAMWLSPQQPKHIVSLGNDTIEYGTILSAQQPINDIRPYITQGDTMVGDYVFYPLNNLSIPNYSIRYRYDALLPVGRYEKTMNDTTITVIDQNHQDAGKFYNLPPVVRSGFLKVIRAKGSIQVDMSHYPGYGPLNPHYTSNHADTAIDPNRVTFLYKRCEEDELHFTTAPPLLPGCYTIAAHLAESPNYTSAIGYLDDVQISSLKALEISISVDYGCIDTPRVVFNAGAPSPVIFKYKVRGSHSSTYTDTAPTQAGNYTLYGYVALYDADSIEYRLEDTINFIVKAKEPIPVFGIRQNNAVYGSPLPEPLVSINLSNSNVYFYYKPRGAHDSAYSSVPAVIKTTSNTLLEKIDTLIPVNSGSYTIRGITEETCRYIQDTAIYDFVITQARGIIRIEQDTGYWGYLPPPRIVQVNDTGRITYAYKNRGDSDAAYSALAPYEIGSYVIRAVMDSTNNHTADTFAVNFVIVKAYGRLVLRQDDGYFNSPLPMPIVLENNDNVEKNDTIRYMYKPADFPDSYFVEDIPTNAGWYVVRGVSKETQHYRAGLTDVLFEIVDTICTQKTAMLVLNYWEKLILVNINANTNGGKAFAQSGITYYWSRNALSLTGSANPPYSTSTLPYFYLNHFPQNGDRYLVWTNTINGEYVRACLHIGAIYTDAPLEQTQEHAWLYPNPINARVQTLTIESEDSVLPIEIYDIGGNKLREHAPTGWTTQISMDALPSGIYVVRHGRRAAVVTLRE